MIEYSILHGDALALLQAMPSASVDAVITDPPYSSGGAFRGDRTGRTTDKYVQSQTRAVRPEFSGDTRDQRSFRYWCALWLGECLRVAKPGAVLCTFTDWRQLPSTTDAIQAGGWVWRGIAVWDKTEGSRPRRGAFRAQAEYIVWGTAGPFNPAEEAPCLPGVFRCPTESGERLHIAQKPLELMRQIVRVCPPAGTILDPFAGSASSGVAAVLEGRSFVGIELDEETAATARERLNQAALQRTLFGPEVRGPEPQPVLFATEGAL